MLDILLLILTLVLLCSWLLYPLFMYLRARFARAYPRYDDAFVPEVTLVLCASNAAATIRKKLENVLALDYPAERLKIWVVSAGSTDETNSIVSSFARSGVLLLAQNGPADEALALNRLMVEVTSEIVVFSDAASLLEPQALRRLVRNFADPRVGLVTGAPASGGGNGELSAAEHGAELWRRWNVRLREWESCCGSVVGADGALWGLRRFLYDPLKTGERNAVVTPLAVVACGFRSVQDSEARYAVPVSRNFAQLLQDAARQARDCLDGLLRVGRAANPIRTGGFSLHFLCRQVIGWLDAFLIPAHFLLLLFVDRSGPFGPLFWAFLGFYLLWAFGAFCGSWRWGTSPCALLNYPFYAGLRRVAALRGVLFRSRCPLSCCSSSRRRCWCMTALAVLLAAAVLRWVTWLGMGHSLLHMLALVLTGLLAWRIIAYPLLLGGLSLLFRQSRQGDANFFPTVSLLIYAHNAEAFIRAKLENALKLDYPEAALKILVLSDGSTDATEAIASEFGQKILLRAERDRRGRLQMLGETVELLDSDIVVFSDVRTFLDAGALRKLVRHFAEPRVGAVAGRLKLYNDSFNWRCSGCGVENIIPELESRCGGMVGFCRALYAVRRESCVRPPRHAAREDLALAVALADQKQLVVFEKEALALCEMPNRDIHAEGVRAVAEGISSHGSKAGVPTVRNGWLFFKFVSHQLLGWTGGVLLALLFVTLLLLFLPGGTMALWEAFLLALLLTSAGVAAMARRFSGLRATLPGHCILRLAGAVLVSLQGCLKGWKEVVLGEEMPR